MKGYERKEWYNGVCKDCEFRLAVYGNKEVSCYCLTIGNPENECFKVKKFMRKENNYGSKRKVRR